MKTAIIVMAAFLVLSMDIFAADANPQGANSGVPKHFLNIKIKPIE